jgi:hypothetical protein
MKNKRYSMSFTTGSLFYKESLTLVVLYIEINDWKMVREKVVSKNLLQARTLNTSKRICREIISRLKTLSASELDLLVNSNSQDQRYILWMAICRRYEFIADFAVEVLRERYISLKTELHQEDYEAFFNRKSEWHPELDEIRPATKQKLRQVLFKILKEVDLLTSNNTINAAMLSPQLSEVISFGNHQDIQFFPVFDASLRRDEVGK